MGLFSKLKEGLSKTRSNLVLKVQNVLRAYSGINDELYEELEEILIQSDVGVKTTMKLVDKIKARIEADNIQDPEKVSGLLKEELVDLIGEADLDILQDKPTILMVVGVNGAGKTTTIGKIAHMAKEAEQKLLMAAGDTFRAGAIDQLKAWASEVGVELIAHEEGSDSAAVAYDAVQAAKARDVDLLIVDTAGRLHTQSNLMEELKKVKRVIDKQADEMAVEVLLVLDATTGQNAISQAKLFDDAVNVDGIALTKLDGTAKGGVVLAVKEELGIPVKYIGVGEGVNDLQEFKAEKFVDALFSE